MATQGEVTRVKIPLDETGRNKGIGFVTFKNPAVASRLVEEGTIKYDFYELPVEAAYFSASMQQRREENQRKDEYFAKRDAE